MRSCGSCVACCVYLKINTPEFTKRGLTHCQHLALTEPVQPDTMQLSSHDCGNCRLGTKKPTVCKEYQCAWLQGYGADEDRPDRSLMLIDNVRGIGNAMECKPLCEDADKREAGRRAIERISQDAGKPALVTSFYERQLAYVVGRPI